MVAHFLNIVGNVCKFLNLNEVVEGFLGNGFDLQLMKQPSFSFFSPPYKRDCCEEIIHCLNLFQF
jgi:hypothetical protein